MTEEFDIHRSEGEGMLQIDAGHQSSVYGFLDKVMERFTENHGFKHFEDAAESLVGEMEGDQRKFFSEVKENLGAIMESFLGPKTWDELQKSERDRIFEFEENESQGVG